MTRIQQNGESSSMIKIHKQLWYVIKPNDKDNLAYMCQYESGKDDQPLSNVAKMQSVSLMF